jgi:hypothetical protein
MYKTISNEIIRKFSPCYDPSEVIKDENEELTVKQWVEKYRDLVPAKNIVWLLLRKEFLSDKDLRLFAVWCARESLKLVENPDIRSVNACDIAERYVNGQATMDELDTARTAIFDVVRHTTASTDATDAAYAATYYAASASAIDAAWYAARAARAAARYDAYFADASRASQIDQLLSYFE